MSSLIRGILSRELAQQRRDQEEISVYEGMEYLFSSTFFVCASVGVALHSIPIVIAAVPLLPVIEKIREINRRE